MTMPLTNRKCCIMQEDKGYSGRAAEESPLQPRVEAYLDIETTGLSPRYSEITVVGIHICGGTETRFVQMVGDGISADCILSQKLKESS